MHEFFYSIHASIARRRWRAAGLFIMLLLLLSYFSARLTFSEDVSKLIPVGKDTDVVTKVFGQLNFADKITVTIHTGPDGSPEDLAMYATAFIDSVSNSCKPFVKSVQGQVGDQNIAQTMDFVYSNLPLFLDPADYNSLHKRLSADSIAATVAANYKILMSPTGIVAKEAILRDPLGLSFVALHKLQQLNIGDDFVLQNGFIMTRDKTKLLLFITPRLPSTETDQNTIFAYRLKSIQQHLDQQFKRKASANYFGAALIAVANAKQIKSDIILTTSIAMTALMLILILFYRKIFIPVIIFLPTLFGGLFALALLYFIKGNISAISLGIGSILIGITIDYSLHILTHYKHNSDVKTLYKDITMPLIMSSSTTAVAFLCLLFVHSEALQDLGIFAAALVMASAVFSLLLIPHLYKPKYRSGTIKNPIDAIAGYAFHKSKLLIGSCTAVIILCFFTYDQVGFNNDLSQLNYIPAEIKAAEKELSESTNLTSKSIYLASYGNSVEEALLHNSALFKKLAAARSGNMILSYSSIGGIALSETEQRRRIADWNVFWDDHTKTELQRNLINEGTKAGFKSNTYQRFFDHLETNFKPISIDAFRSLEAMQMNEFIVEKNGFYTVSTLVKVKPKQREHFVAMVSAQTNVVVIDRQQLNESFLEKLKTDFNTLINYSFIAVVLILFFFFRRIELVIISCIPIVITGIVTAGIMGIFNIELNIFSTIVCTLIFGHSVDFSIFMTSALQKEYTNGSNEIAIYRTSIILAVITTILGIGALIFAKHPALQSISSVSLIGVMAALIITFIFYPLLFRIVLSKRANNGQAPIEIKRVLHSTLSFVYYGLGGFLLAALSIVLIKIVPLKRDRKLRIFHYLMSKFMQSVLASYPSIRRKIINNPGETFEKPAIIIANHSSFLDILAIGMLSPKIIFLVNDWVYNSPIFGKAVKLAGFYPVSQGLDNGIGHLRTKVAQGFSLMVFPEGTRSTDNTVKRFHKGAFLLAAEFELDIIPIVIHGYSEILPKGDFVINGGQATVVILDRIAYNDPAYGMDYTERSKKISLYFKTQYALIRQQREGACYFQKMLVNSYDYKEQSVITAVKKDLKRNLPLYHRLNQYIPATAAVLHFADDYGQLDVLLTLQHPGRKIQSFIADSERRAVAKMNYLLKKRKITYPDVTSADSATQTICLISAGINISTIPAAVNSCIILHPTPELTETMVNFGFSISEQDEQLLVLKKVAK